MFSRKIIPPRNGGSHYGAINIRKKNAFIKRRIIIVICCLTVVVLIAALGYFIMNKTRPTPPEHVPFTPQEIDQKSSETVSEVVAPPPPVPKAEPLPCVQDDPAKTGYQSGNVFIYDKAGYEPFGGSEGMATKYAGIIKKAKDSFGPGITVYNMVVPTHVEFGLPPKHKNITNSQKKNIETIYSNYGAEGIKPINVYDALAMHSNEYIYFNTDHHWTSSGAHYAYTEFAKVAGFEPMKLESLTKKTISPFVGSYYTFTKDEIFNSNPDHVDYYQVPGTYDCQILEIGKTTPITVPMLSETSSGRYSYSVFVWGDNTYMQIKNQQKNGRRLAVIKESYANALVPFLAPHYEEIHLIEIRYFKDNLKDYMAAHGINEVLFVNNELSANTGTIQKNMETLIGIS